MSTEHVHSPTVEYPDRLPEVAPGEPGSGRARRLTLRRVVGDAMVRFFNLERGWLPTARELCTEPGAMVRRYVEGDRTSYANPFTYLVLCVAFSLVLETVTGFRKRIMKGMLQAGQDMSPGLQELFNQCVELIFQYGMYVILFPFALLMRLFFRRSGYNLAEVLVFTFYTGGQIVLFAIVIIPLYFVFPHGSMLNTVLGMIIFPYWAYAAVGFFGKGVGTVVKTILAVIFSYAILFLLPVIGMLLIYVFAFRPSSALVEDWNLVSAAEKNVVNKARELLEEGADVDLTLGRTPLHVAAEKGHAEMVELLVTHGANVNARDHLERVPMFLALSGGHQEIASRLAEAGTDATARAADDATLLIIALRQKDEHLALWALEGGVDVNVVRQDARRATALIIAAEDGSKFKTFETQVFEPGVPFKTLETQAGARGSSF